MKVPDVAKRMREIAELIQKNTQGNLASYSNLRMSLGGVFQAREPPRLARPSPRSCMKRFGNMPKLTPECLSRR